MGKVAMIVKLKAQSGRRDEIVGALSAMFTPVEEEAGTEIYALHLDSSDPDTVWMYELYTDSDGLGAHAGSPALEQLGAALGQVLGAPPEVINLELVKAKVVAD